MVGHKYTPEEHEFLKRFIPGHTYAEIVEAYNQKFEEPITRSRVKGYMANHKINNGLTGRFKKGNVPFNKGCKGVCALGCEKSWFKTGHVPSNHRAVGSERITKDGYIEIKIAEPNKWQLKHRFVWEEVNGQIPKGKNIRFLDGDKLNCNIENLALVSKAENLEITRQGLQYENPELTKTGVLIARSAILSKNKKR